MNDSLSTWPSQMFPTGGGTSTDRADLVRLLSEKHMIETLERFKWVDLPPELPQDIIERILYFRGKGAFFKYADKFWFLPLALKGTIDSYGRYETITPVLFTGQWDTEGKKWKDSAFLPESATSHKFVVAYNKPIEKEGKEVDSSETKFEPAIILTDRSLGLSQDIEPHYSKVKVLIERLVNTIIMIEINNINGLQTYALWVKDETQKEAVEAEFNSYDKRILSGKRVIVMVGDGTSDPFKELTTAKNISDSQRYWQSFQAWDNLRKSIIGVSNGGQALKMEHATQAETMMNSEGADAVFNNAKRMREDFAELVNHYYGLNISIECDEPEEMPLQPGDGSQTEQINDQKGEN